MERGCYRKWCGSNYIDEFLEWLIVVAMPVVGRPRWHLPLIVRTLNVFAILVLEESLVDLRRSSDLRNRSRTRGGKIK